MRQSDGHFAIGWERVPSLQFSNRGPIRSRCLIERLVKRLFVEAPSTAGPPPSSPGSALLPSTPGLRTLLGRPVPAAHALRSSSEAAVERTSTRACRRPRKKRQKQTCTQSPPHTPRPARTPAGPPPRVLRRSHLPIRPPTRYTSPPLARWSRPRYRCARTSK